jgi:hypothetical protein
MAISTFETLPPFGQANYAYSTHYLHKCAVFRGYYTHKKGGLRPKKLCV